MSLFHWCSRADICPCFIGAAGLTGICPYFIGAAGYVPGIFSLTPTDWNVYTGVYDNELVTVYNIITRGENAA